MVSSEAIVASKDGRSGGGRCFRCDRVDLCVDISDCGRDIGGYLCLRCSVGSHTHDLTRESGLQREERKGVREGVREEIRKVK